MFLQRSGWYFFSKHECGKRLENSAPATLGTKHTQLRHAVLVTSLKSPVAKCLTSHLWEFLATLDEGSGWSRPVQQVDPLAVSTVTAVSRIGSTDANFVYISRVPFPGCCLCPLERKNTDFSLRPWLFGAKLLFGKNPNRIKGQRSLS
jgi:hypothetical protein